MRKSVLGTLLLAAALVKAAPSVADPVSVSFSFAGDPAFSGTPGATVLTGTVSGLLTGLDNSDIGGVQTPTGVLIESYPAGFASTALAGYGPLPINLLDASNWSTSVEFSFATSSTGTVVLTSHSLASDVFVVYITNDVAELQALDAGHNVFVAGVTDPGPGMQVPEPWSAGLLAVGLIGMAASRRSATPWFKPGARIARRS